MPIRPATSGPWAPLRSGSGASVSAMSTPSSQQRNRSRGGKSRSSRGPRTVSGTPVVIPTVPGGPLEGIDAERERSGRWPSIAAALCGVVVGLFGALIAIPGGPLVMIPVFILLSVGVGYFIHHNAASAAINAIAATVVPSGAVPRVDALLDSLSASFGVALPELALLDDAVHNASIVARRGSATVILTTGLLNALSVVELEGVLGHLLARERLGSVARSTTGAGIAVLLGLIGRAGSVSHRLIGEGGLFRADEIAAVTVRYPTGLAGALSVMVGSPLPVAGSFFASRSYETLRWLFVDPSIAHRAAEDDFDDADATGVRRAALLEW